MPDAMPELAQEAMTIRLDQFQVNAVNSQEASLKALFAVENVGLHPIPERIAIKRAQFLSFKKIS